ncbi:MAG: helix-turn-helix transcriptional regulator [Anaerocolumna sp.]
MNEELYTPQEVADLLKIKKNTVYELIKRGDLKCRKIGKQFRIRKDELEEYLNLADNNISGGEYDIQNTGKEVITGNMLKNGNVSDANIESEIVSGRDSLKKPDSMVDNAPDASVYNSQRDSGTANESYGNRGLIICGQDILLEILCNYLSGQLQDLPIFRSYLGSYNGLYALYQGKVDVATAHLWDGETGEYNKEFVKRMLPGIAYQRIHLVNRMQGFYVKEGNPKQINDFKDLTRDDIIMINREKGSGTRILLDQYLLKSGIKPSQLNGYEKEVTSHLACAGAVARGGADVAIGNERISKELKGIEFVPIQMESYDLVIKLESTRYNWYQELIQIINSTEFKEELERMSGYDITDIGKILD